jgi:hypothetical protein
MAVPNSSTAVVGLLAFLVLAALAPSVSAQATELRCTIPFSFVVNSRILPPGDYRVSDVGQGVLYVRDLVHGAFALNTRVDEENAAADSRPRLVFHRYGEDYVLREVWMGATEGRELPEPRRERELRNAALDAMDPTSPVRVVLGAR